MYFFNGIWFEIVNSNENTPRVWIIWCKIGFGPLGGTVLDLNGGRLFRLSHHRDYLALGRTLRVFFRKTDNNVCFIISFKNSITYEWSKIVDHMKLKTFSLIGPNETETFFLLRTICKLKLFGISDHIKLKTFLK